MITIPMKGRGQNPVKSTPVPTSQPKPEAPKSVLIEETIEQDSWFDREHYKSMTLKELKERYIYLGGERAVEAITKKDKIIDLILGISNDETK